MTLHLLDELEHLPHEHALTLSSIEADLERAEHARLAFLMEQTLRTPVTAGGKINTPLDPANLHSPKLFLPDYLESMAAPPAHVWRGVWPGFRDILGNGDWGDCGEAMALHGFEAVQTAAGRPASPFTVADAESLYGVVGGFDPKAGPPGQNPTDNGTDNRVLAKVMREQGARCANDGSVHKWTATIDVPVGNILAERIAIAEFVVLYRALNLPANIEGQKTWWLRGDGKTGDSAPGSAGGHDVPYIGYAANGDWDADSWGLLIPVGHRFDPIYALQGFVGLTPEMLNRQGVSPTGLNWTRLLADVAKLGTPMAA